MRNWESHILPGLKRAGHTPIILERVKEIAEVGAGIQLAPNNMRILGRFGVLPELMKYTNLLERNSLRRWKDNEELGTAPLMPDVCGCSHFILVISLTLLGCETIQSSSWCDSSR